MAVLRKSGLGGITGSPQAFFACCALLLVLLGVPLLHNGYYENLFRGILMFSAMALGWNIIGGYTGYVSFGNVVFFGIGTYVSGFLSLHGVQNVWLAIPCAMLLAAAFAALLGIPILRLRGHYFGIATLGIALATQEIVANVEPLGGGTGITLQQAAWFSQYYYAMWLVCALSLVATWFIARSKLGYALVAIRENEDAAAVLGVNPTAYKVVAWAISATMAAAAGAVFAFSNGFIDPSVGFAVDYNVFPIVMVDLGRPRNRGGAGRRRVSPDGDQRDAVESLPPSTHALLRRGDRVGRAVPAARLALRLRPQRRMAWILQVAHEPIAYERDAQRSAASGCASAVCRRSTTSASTSRRVP